MKSLTLFIGIVLLSSTVLANETNTLTAEWQEQKVNFLYNGYTTKYTCNGLKTKIKKLSGGQRKRVSLGIELLTSPPLLFLDELKEVAVRVLESHVLTLRHLVYL